MKTKLMVTAIAVLSIAAFSAPTASAAACGEQTSQERHTGQSTDPNAPDYNPNAGQPTGDDKLADTTPGGQLYGDADEGSMSGYIGTTGNAGFLDASGSQSSGGVTVQGYQTNSGVNGKATVGTSPSVCVEDTDVL